MTINEMTADFTIKYPIDRAGAHKSIYRPSAVNDVYYHEYSDRMAYNSTKQYGGKLDDTDNDGVPDDRELDMGMIVDNKDGLPINSYPVFSGSPKSNAPRDQELFAWICECFNKDYGSINVTEIKDGKHVDHPLGAYLGQVPQKASHDI